MDDTCCILRKGDVEGLLHHLNIGFTMEVEKDGSLPFLDTKLTKKEDGKLDITANRRTRTGTGLTIQHVKRSTVRCLYDRARCIVQQGENHRLCGERLSSSLSSESGFLSARLWS